MKNAVANEGPRMKRIRPAPMGRAYRYQRRIAHIEIVLAERGKNGEAVATVVGEEAAAQGSGESEDGQAAAAKKVGGQEETAAKKSFCTRRTGS